MPKITTRNTVTPKRRELSKWGFTTREGGQIYRFRFPTNEVAIERMKKELSNYNCWGKYPGPHPEGKGSRNYTIVKIIPDYDVIKIHSLFFPDGTVWDSTIRGYRRIKDYELT